MKSYKKALPSKSNSQRATSASTATNTLADPQMWRKFNKAKDPSIGAPTLIETTFDQQYLDTIPEIDSLRSGASSAASPSLPAFSLLVQRNPKYLG